MRNKRFADFFCGLGAFHEAFNSLNAGYKCVFACDIDKTVRRIYTDNYGIVPEGDINLLNIEKIPNFDILCAGFPCQSFSIAGNREGFKDKERGALFFRLLEVIDKKKPKKIILENVRNLKTIDDGAVFQTIVSQLEKRGYHVSHEVLDSKYFNSPQSRKRLYIVADKKKLYRFPNVKMPLRPVSSIIDHSVNQFYDYRKKYKLQRATGGHLKYVLVNKSTGKSNRQGERVYSIDDYGPTICASSGGPGSKTGLYQIGNKIRKLSVPEALQMSGFKTTYKYRESDDMLRYIGNSIVVNVLVEILKNI